MALDENKNKKDWRTTLWKVMNITKGFVKELKKEEKRVYRNMVTKSLQPQNNPTNHNPKTIPSFRKQIPWLGSKKQLQTLLELLYQNQLISSSNINVMISTHFWDAKNQKRFGNLKSYGRQNNLIPWIGSQGQLKKLFQLLVKPKKKRLIEWPQMSYTEICKHFTNQKKQQPFKPLNLSKLDLAFSNKTNLALIENIVIQTSMA